MWKKPIPKGYLQFPKSLKTTKLQTWRTDLGCWGLRVGTCEGRCFKEGARGIWPALIRQLCSFFFFFDSSVFWLWWHCDVFDCGCILIWRLHTSTRTVLSHRDTQKWVYAKMSEIWVRSVVFYADARPQVLTEDSGHAKCHHQGKSTWDLPCSMFCNFLGVCNSLFLFLFLMQTIFKVFIEFVTILLLFMVWFFG